MKGNFSKSLLKLLSERNLSQKELAANLKTKESVVSHWITEKTEPTTKSIGKLANYFNVPVSYFYGGEITENGNEKDLIDQLRSKDREIEILKKEIALRDREIAFLKTQISR